MDRSYILLFTASLSGVLLTCSAQKGVSFTCYGDGLCHECQASSCKSGLCRRLAPCNMEMTESECKKNCPPQVYFCDTKRGTCSSCKLCDGKACKSRCKDGLELYDGRDDCDVSCKEKMRKISHNCKDDHAVPSNCTRCERTCDPDYRLRCDSPFDGSSLTDCDRPGCVCEKGYVRKSKDADSQCIPKNQCRACPPDQRYTFAGCPARTCAEPTKSQKSCKTTGCVCNDPDLYINAHDECVALKWCPRKSGGVPKACKTTGCVCNDPDLYINAHDECVALKWCPQQWRFQCDPKKKTCSICMNSQSIKTKNKKLKCEDNLPVFDTEHLCVDACRSGKVKAAGKLTDPVEPLPNPPDVTATTSESDYSFTETTQEPSYLDNPDDDEYEYYYYGDTNNING